MEKVGKSVDIQILEHILVQINAVVNTIWAVLIQFWQEKPNMDCTISSFIRYHIVHVMKGEKVFQTKYFINHYSIIGDHSW